MKKAKLAASLIAVSMAATTLLTGCDNSQTSGNSTPTNSNSGNNSAGGGESNKPEEPAKEIVPGTDYKVGTTLRMATGYNNAQTGITFNAKLMDSFGVDGKITLANGKSYSVGDLKPTWQTLEDKLKVKFNSIYQGKSGSDEFEYWKEQLDAVDILSGTASKLTEAGAAGSFVNLAEHLNEMPNFKAYLEANPIVRLSITGSTTGANKGAIYFSPYFDGVDDIERMPLMRTDWVKTLLNGSEFTASSSKQTATPVYQPYMPTTGAVDVDVVKADGSGVEKIKKDYDKAGNIIAKMNAAGSMSGVDAVNMLRTYIDEAYNGYYGENRADLFIGQNAAWDADELVALLRCVVANPQALNGKDSVFGLFSREDGNNQRKVDLFRFAGTLFGVRGLESRQDYLYVGNDGALHDARMEEDTYIAMERMNALTQEGLISSDFVNDVKDMDSSKVLAQDAGFMSYDYNQTQTLYNDDGKTFSAGEEYMAVMVPVARWKDGGPDGGETIMRFTESWRSVKTDGWGISIKGINGDNDKLKAALKLIDYAYSAEGQILMSYGPDEFIKMEGGKYVMFDFNGQQWPEIADATREELWSKGKGNYTNYARQLLGSTLSFLKSQAFEFQCTSTLGREGAGRISTAIALGTIHHPELAIAKNLWYTSVPTVLPLTKNENDTINTYTMLGSGGKFSTSSSKDKAAENLFVDIIAKGYSGEGTSSREACINSVTSEWGGTQVLKLRDTAWKSLKNFYEG